MRSNPSRLRRLLVLAALTPVAIGACSGGAATPAPTPTPATPGILETIPQSSATLQNEVVTRKVIDVRTPAEYAAGHIKGAVNIDIESSEFDAQINALPKTAAYLVYCRSGNRSRNAAAIMKAAGFTNVFDGGAMSALVAAGAQTE